MTMEFFFGELGFGLWLLGSNHTARNEFALCSVCPLGSPTRLRPDFPRDSAIAMPGYQSLRVSNCRVWRHVKARLPPVRSLYPTRRTKEICRLGTCLQKVIKGNRYNPRQRIMPCVSSISVERLDGLRKYFQSGNEDRINICAIHLFILSALSRSTRHWFIRDY
jgi:hypothetical protein